MSYNQAMTIKKTRDLIRLVESFGWRFSRQSGSHMIYTAQDKNPLSIPDKREIARGTLRNVLKLVYN